MPYVLRSPNLDEVNTLSMPPQKYYIGQALVKPPTIVFSTVIGFASEMGALKKLHSCFDEKLLFQLRKSIVYTASQITKTLW